jgi:DNA-binding CsgD family transcriptional regulator
VGTAGGHPSGDGGHGWDVPLVGPTAHAALDLAVAGCRPDILAAMAASAGWTTDDLDPLLQAGLIELDGGRTVRFSSDAARELMLANASRAAVGDAHRRAAEAANDLRLPVRVVLDHLEQSTLLADEQVALDLERLAARAEAEDDLRVASDAWRAAARLSTTASTRVARAVRSLRLVIVKGLDYADVDELLDLLAGEQVSNECACWVEWLKSLQRSEVDPASAVTAQWSTICRVRDAAPSTLRALLWDAAMNAWTLGDVDGGLRAAREFADLTAGPSDDASVEPPWAGTALVAAGLFQAGDVAGAMALRREAIEAAAEVDPVEVPFDRLLSIVFLDDLILDVSAEADHRILVAMQRATPDSATLACLLGIEAWRARARGEWSRADELLAHGRPLASATGAVGAQLGMAALGVELAAIRGADDQLVAEAGPLRTLCGRKGDRRRQATLDRALGLHALAEGRLDEAVVRLAVAAGAPFLGRGLRDGVLPARAELVEALARQGDATGAGAVAEELRPLLVAMDDPRARALERRVAALTAPDAQALELYREALAGTGVEGDRFERARVLLLLGSHERRCRHRSDARQHLFEAVDAFATIGARAWLARARTELRACGGQVDQPVDGVALTAQELAVARLAATGLSTREVADALFLSPRTVEFHLGNAYRKLGVRGRSALRPRLEELDAVVTVP